MQNILIADDHEIVVTGLKHKLSYELENIEFFIASNPNEAIEIVKDNEIDIAIIDLFFFNSPENSGLEVSRTIKIIKPDTKIVIFSGFTSRFFFLKQLLRIKVEAIVSKNDGNKAILDVVDAVINGDENIYSKEVRKEISNLRKLESQYKGLLTKGEKGILILLHKKKGNKEIANKLGIQIDSVRFHLKNMYLKLNVNSKAKLIEKTADILYIL